MIAAIALHHGLELVTGNTAHFQRIQQLGYPLTVANWRIASRPLSPVALMPGNIPQDSLRAGFRDFRRGA